MEIYKKTGSISGSSRAPYRPSRFVINKVYNKGGKYEKTIPVALTADDKQTGHFSFIVDEQVPYMGCAGDDNANLLFDFKTTGMAADRVIKTRNSPVSCKPEIECCTDLLRQNTLESWVDPPLNLWVVASAYRYNGNATAIEYVSDAILLIIKIRKDGLAAVNYSNGQNLATIKFRVDEAIWYRACSTSIQGKNGYVLSIQGFDNY